MQILFLKGFNNYSNKIVLKYDTLSDYQNRASSYVDFSGINFVPNDGVDTTLIVGSTAQLESGAALNWQDGAPDYCVCYETTTVEEVTTVTIKSRWYIIECVRTRDGQYELTLHRDVIADNYEQVLESTCFVEKGLITDINDSAIYNKEDLTLNEIKSDEFLLKDETQCGWVVGYVAKSGTYVDPSTGAITPQDTVFSAVDLDSVDASDASAQETYATMTDFYAAKADILSDLALLNYHKSSVRLDVYYRKIFSYFRTGQKVTLTNTNALGYAEVGYQNGAYLKTADSSDPNCWQGWLFDYRDTACRNLVNGWNSSGYKQAISDYIANSENIVWVTENDVKLKNLYDYINKSPTIKIGTKFYKPFDVYGEAGQNGTVVGSIHPQVNSAAYTAMYNNLNLNPVVNIYGNVDHIVGTPGPETFTLEWSYTKHKLGIREIFPKCRAKVPGSVPELKDAPYHMFAIPFGDDLAIYSGNTLHCTTKKSVALAAAQALTAKAGVGAIYDVQILPYCPIRNIIQTEKIEPGWKKSQGTFGSNRIPLMNHSYCLSKDLVFNANKRAYGFASNYLGPSVPIPTANGKIYTDGEVTSTIPAIYALTVALEDLTDPTSDPILKIYISQTEFSNDNPSITTSYSTFVSSDSDIQITFITSPGLLINYATVNSNDQLVFNRSNEAFNTNVPALLNDYNYFEFGGYYSKIDIGNVIYSDIVLLAGEPLVETDVVNTIIWGNESQFTFNKYVEDYYLLNSSGGYTKDALHEEMRSYLSAGSNIEDKKVKNQTDKIRIASPNYSNFFDINIAANNGIDYFNIDCTYKPYQPYIHVNPNFGGLYGSDYDDVRGLICGGDFSIALTTDAWATYQLNNKNYQAIFDRQIQQLEVQNQIQRDIDVTKAVTGSIVGAGAGALAGFKVGGGAGAIIGGALGGSLSAVGGAADVTNNQRLREIQMQTQKDIFGYQLGNIQALPQGLAKTSALTNNNKIFPYIEYYTCTDVEERALRNQLTYNGMTIKRIGKVKDFITANYLAFIKGKLIRVNLIDDAHVATEIGNELATGVYIATGDVTQALLASPRSRTRR